MSPEMKESCSFLILTVTIDIHPFLKAKLLQLLRVGWKLPTKQSLSLSTVS